MHLKLLASAKSAGREVEALGNVEKIQKLLQTHLKN